LQACKGVTRVLPLLLSFGCWAWVAVSAHNVPSDGAEPALRLFLARPAERVMQYRARRTLEGHNERFNLHASLEVNTELSSPGHFTYSIVREHGSEYIREKLRQLLDAEAKMVRTGEPSRVAFTPDNYELSAGLIVEPGIVKLVAKPRRKDLALIDGALFVTTDEGDLVRIEGVMAKTPSFWTSKVYLVRHYDRIAGVRVPVRLDSRASIKLAGEAALSMVYDYEMVNGTVVNP
jgi:hypothetical protein